MHVLAAIVVTAGSLCFSPNECVPTTAAKVDVKPADVERRYVWTSQDATNIILGTLAPKATEVDLEAKQPATKLLTLSVTGDAKRGWPAATRFTYGSEKQSWTWTEPAGIAEKPLMLRVPPGDKSLTIAADHHRTVRKLLQGDRDMTFGQIELLPLPVIFGRVVKREKRDGESWDAPVAGAQLSREDGKVAVTTDAEGTFRTELAEPVTGKLLVLAPGMATRVVSFRSSATEANLGTIRLATGVTLTVHLERERSAATAAIRAVLRRQDAEEPIAERVLEPSPADDLTFSNLAEGDYFLLLHGERPLEHLGAAISVRDRDSTSDIRLVPFMLEGTVRLGDEPVRDGSVDIMDQRRGIWHASAPIDSEGRFGGIAWQTTDVIGYVQSRDLGSALIENPPNLSGDPAHWDIAFPKLLITGRVFDADTNGVVPDVVLRTNVAVRSSPDNTIGLRQSVGRVTLQPDGTFSLRAYADASYSFSARAPGYADATQAFEFTANDSTKHIEFALKRGTEVVIQATWPGGEPIPGAHVTTGGGSDGINADWMTTADSDGMVMLKLARGDVRTVFVIPPQGSLAVAKVSAPADGSPVRIVVPRPAGTLLIRVNDAESRPSFAQIAFRYNGEWVPASVVARMSRSLERGLLRRVVLPAGSYELWPLSMGFDSFLAPPSRPPVQVGFNGGDQEVTLTLPSR